jgi:hypothetical protein
MNHPAVLKGLPIRGARILPVQIQAVEPVLRQQVHGGLDEAPAGVGGGRHLGILFPALVPAADGQHDAQRGVLALEGDGGLVRAW